MDGFRADLQLRLTSTFPLVKPSCMFRSLASRQAGSWFLRRDLFAHRLVISERMSRSTSRHRSSSHPPRSSTWNHLKKTTAIPVHRMAPPASFMVSPAMDRTARHTLVVRLLLEHGGYSADALSDALDAATRQKLPDVVALLEKAGAKPKEKK